MSLSILQLLTLSSHIHIRHLDALVNQHLLIQHLISHSLLVDRCLIAARSFGWLVHHLLILGYRRSLHVFHSYHLICGFDLLFILNGLLLWFPFLFGLIVECYISLAHCPSPLRRLPLLTLALMNVHPCRGTDTLHLLSLLTSMATKVSIWVTYDSFMLRSSVWTEFLIGLLNTSTQHRRLVCNQLTLIMCETLVLEGRLQI